MPPTEETKGTVVRLDIPPDHHPAVISGDAPGAHLGRTALANLYEAHGKIADTAARVDDKARLASAAQPVAERALGRAERAATTMRQQVQHLDDEIGKALKPPVEPALASQIRNHWAVQAAEPDANVLGPLRAAIQAGDTATTSAVLNAPAYLSGLTEENQGLLRAMAAERFAPERVAARAQTADALARVERATGHFMETMAERLREWRDDDAKVIEEGLR